MASFCEAREGFLLAFDQDMIRDEEFVLLYNLNTSKKFDYCYRLQNYNRFCLDDWSDENARVILDFLKEMSIEFSKY